MAKAGKSAEAFRTISEVADELAVPKHVLRFWEGKFPQIHPMKRGGGRRYYRPEDMDLLKGIKQLLHHHGFTIKGVQRILREQGAQRVKSAAAGAAVVPLAKGAAEPVGARRVSLRGAARARTRPPGLDDTQRDVIAGIMRELEFCRSVLRAAPARSQVLLRNAGAPRAASR